MMIIVIKERYKKDPESLDKNTSACLRVYVRAVMNRKKAMYENLLLRGKIKCK